MKSAVRYLTLLAMISFCVLCTTGCTPETKATGATELSAIPSAGFSHYYEEIPVNLPGSYQGPDYSLPVNLATVKNFGEYTFSDAQKALLGQNGFVVMPSDWLDFYYPVYDEGYYLNLPVFITTDSVYNVYHLVFDKILRDLEREKLGPAIESLTAAMVDAAETQFDRAKGTELENAAYGVLGFFAVAQQLIEEEPPDIPTVVAGDVTRELRLIEAHNGISESPLFSLKEDYSQYVPRGHYTLDDQLERYFCTMMWYGRINFTLDKPDATRMAILITRLARMTTVDGVPAAEIWAGVYDPTVFFVGKSDDLGIHDYGSLMDKTYGASPELSQFAEDSLLEDFIEAANQLPPPLINSMFVLLNEDKKAVTKGFRFMGQRFVLDAYIFEKLTMREVEKRWLPKGLDLFAAMGNDNAYSILDEMGETSFTNYDTQLEKLRESISALDIDTWAQNIYWNWLYALQAVAAPKGEAYPAFMRTEAWARKDLHTALGSWTELKHDTILYAKQFMAEAGNGGEVEIVRGYVEPNPEAFARLLALTRMTNTGLNECDILTDYTEDLLVDLEDMLAFLKEVAEWELSGNEISEDDYKRIAYYGNWLESMSIRSADSMGGQGKSYFAEPKQAALVADVGTDPVGGKVLEEAIGRIFQICVVVPDGLDGLQVAKGAVYSYYEFTWPMSDRLTNEKWRKMLDEGIQPDRPSWTESFIAE